MTPLKRSSIGFRRLSPTMRIKILNEKKAADNEATS